MYPPRIQLPNLVYHVYNRGNNRRTVFQRDKDYRRFIEIVERYKNKFQVRLYSYVLMPNHFHFMLETISNNSLARFMQAVTLSYAIYKNRCTDVTGHVWQGRYKQTIIENDAYFLQCSRYIELNPLRAGMVVHPKDYEWSSYKAHTGIIEDRLVDGHPLLHDLAAGGKDWREMYQEFVEIEM